MSSQKSRPHETHATMAKILLSQRSGIDENIFTRNDIGAARQAQGRQAYLKGMATAGGSIIVGADGEKKIIVAKG